MAVLDFARTRRDRALRRDVVRDDNQSFAPAATIRMPAWNAGCRLHRQARKIPDGQRPGSEGSRRNAIDYGYLRRLERGQEGFSMTKSELIDAVARRTQITKSRAELVVN